MTMNVDVRGSKRMVRGLLWAGVAMLSVGLAMTGAVPAGAAPPLPNLVVEPPSIVTGSLVVGSDVTFGALVRNTGTAATVAGVVTGVAFSVDGRLVTWSDNTTWALSADPQAGMPVIANSGPTGSSTWRATPGRHTVRAWVDDVNRIQESNEHDNTSTWTVVVPQPGVRPVTRVAARVASSQAQYEVTHSPDVTVSWTTPVRQRRGTTYTVVEHPVLLDGPLSCGGLGDITRVTTTSSSVTLPQASGGSCGGHTSRWKSTFSVVANAPGVAGADSGDTGVCVREFSTNNFAPTAAEQFWSQSCVDGGSVHDTTQPYRSVAVIDAGGPGDTGFVGGHVYSATGDLPEQYRTTRWGWSRYEVPVPAAGRYRVTFSVVDPTWTRPGQRVFSLRAEGRLVRDRLDVVADVGPNAVERIDAYVDVTDGALTVDASRLVDNPIVSLIEVTGTVPADS